MLQAALMTLAVVAAAPQLTATQTLKARDAQIRAVLPPPGQAPSPKVRRQIEDAVLSVVDLEQMARDALGQNWVKQPPRKRREFVQAFRDRFRTVSGKQLDMYRGTTTKFLPEQPVSPSRVKVPTELTINGEPTDVTYVMQRERQGWRIVDIIVDDVSTVQNYRSTFNKVIAKEGFDGLISRLRHAGTGGGSNAGG